MQAMLELLKKPEPSQRKIFSVLCAKCWKSREVAGDSPGRRYSICHERLMREHCKRFEKEGDISETNN